MREVNCDYKINRKCLQTSQHFFFSIVSNIFLVNFLVNMVNNNIHLSYILIKKIIYPLWIVMGLDCGPNHGKHQLGRQSPEQRSPIQFGLSQIFEHLWIRWPPKNNTNGFLEMRDQKKKKKKTIDDWKLASCIIRRKKEKKR